MTTKVFKRIILLLFLNLLLLGCGDDNMDNIDFNVDFLMQTKWKGVLKESSISDNQPQTETWSVGLFFITNDGGEYTLQNTDHGRQPLEYTFEYFIDGKILKINQGWGAGRSLDGNWLLIQSDQDNLVFEKGTGGEGAHMVTMTLKRVH